MPLIILGILVIAGLLAYIYFTGQSGNFTKKKSKDKSAQKQSEPADVIYLPNDIEKEKKRRNVKVGK